jgi:hypothetical protein
MTLKPTREEIALLETMRRREIDAGALRKTVDAIPDEVSSLISLVKAAQEDALDMDKERSLVRDLNEFLKELSRCGLTMATLGSCKEWPVISTSLTTEDLSRLKQMKRIDIRRPEEAERFSLDSKMAKLRTDDGFECHVYLNPGKNSILVLRLEEDEDS